jgi:hypothetical protein
MKKIGIFLLAILLLSACSMQDSNMDTMRSNNVGQAGSLARFAIDGNRLYVVDKTSLITIDISTPNEPKQTHQTNIGLGIETIFPYQNKLFIGSEDAVYIYDFSNPDRPELLSRYQHITACDPVVAQGNYAYVTLRSGSGRCPRNINVLEVLDISNPRNPQVVGSVNMLNPHGLGVNGNNLFVCEGNFGLKRFDISNPTQPQQIEFLQDVASFDVIPRSQTLVVTGQNGLYQFDYSQIPMQQLSFISVQQ